MKLKHTIKFAMLLMVTSFFLSTNFVEAQNRKKKKDKNQTEAAVTPEKKSKEKND